jgi:hypothetical protein
MREVDRLQTDVRSASGGMDAVGRYEVLRKALVGVVPILLRYRVISTALVQQPQLWHLHWLGSVHFVSDQYSYVITYNDKQGCTERPDIAF